MIVVDFSPVCMAAAFSSGKELSEDLLRHLTLNSLSMYRRKFKKYGDMVVVFDDGNYWRKDIHPTYKAHRAAAREKNEDFDWSAFFKYQKVIKEELSHVFPYKWLQIERLEADDIIGHIALTAKEETVIISPDGDFVQCLRNPRVKVWSNLSKKFIPDMTMYEVELALHTKILKGDGVNMKGGDGINNVMTPLSEIPVRQKSITQRLITHTFECGLGQDIKERYEQNKTLIDLREIPKEYKVKIEEAFNEPITGSKARVFNYLSQPKLNRVGSFISFIDDFC